MAGIELKLDANTDWLVDFSISHGSKHMLSFSCGKDAIATWLVLRDRGIEVVPYYLYLIPDLEFIEEQVVYFEKFFETKICRLPHPSFFRMIDAAVFQPPNRIDVIDRIDPQVYSYDLIREIVASQSGLPVGAIAASGVRAADSIVRRISFQKYGHVRRDQFFPVWNFRKKHIYEWIDSHKVRLPVDYEMFGRSFDGIDARFLVPIKKRFPADYQKILDCFPLAEIEVFRHEHF
jgi:hypothetical protein